ncbi:MAG: protein-glutamate O-methyltransferase [Candidatus Muiribacteriota bacterium]|jgi:chemotaxis protein methyltransferase CheR
MKNEDFKKICNIVYDKSGINLKDGKEALVSARISKRIRALKLNDFDEYMHFLENDNTGEEVSSLIDVITTNVTSFFREKSSLDSAAEYLEKWIENSQKTIKIWSAACSSGEEPYTLAMIIDDILKSKNKHFSDIKILATDISTTILQKAIDGVYAKEKLENIPPALKNRYFSKNSASRNCNLYKVNDVLRKYIIFRQFNLKTEQYPLKGPIDMIFCRNVMIYFDNETRATIVKKMHDLLKPGGIFVVGNAESLSGRTGNFKLIKPAVYIKQ